MTACSSSVFSNDHAGECDSNNTVRTLESEDAMDAMELLVNETRQTAAVSRTLMVNFFPEKLIPIGCPELEGRPWAYQSFPTKHGLAQCVRFDIAEVVDHGLPFKWEIGWMNIGGGFAIWLKLESCIDLQTLFGIGPPLFAEICIGGEINFGTESPCPQVKGIVISGSAWIVFEIGLDFWICKIVFANITLGFEAGLDWATLATRCWWVHNEGLSRRRWWTRRRRAWRRCNFRNDCDIYVKGWVEITLLIIRAKLEFVYWVKNKELQILLTLSAWAFKWWEAFSTCVYRRHFR